jgi:hypothetical protein
MTNNSKHETKTFLQPGKGLALANQQDNSGEIHSKESFCSLLIQIKTSR